MSIEYPDLLRGDTFILPLEVVDADTGAAIDITGRKYIWTGKRSLDLTDVQATGDAGWQVSVTATGAAAAAGKVTLTVVASKTGLLSGLYFTDVQETTPATPEAIVTTIAAPTQVKVLDDCSRNT